MNPRLSTLRVAVWVGAILVLVNAPWPASCSAEDIVVREIRVEGLASIGSDELLYLLDVAPGETISPEDVTRGIKRAFLKDVFEEISVEEVGGEPGVLLVRVREQEIVGDIDIRGLERVRKSFVRKHLGITEGDVFERRHLDDMVAGLLDALALHGFPAARVIVDIKETDTPYRLALAISVQEGEPVWIRRLRFVGVPGEDVAPYVRLRGDEIFDQYKVRQEMERLEQHLKEQRYLEPRVGPYRFEAGLLEVHVDPGRSLSVRFVGNENVGNRQLSALMPFHQAGDVSDDLIAEAVTRILTLYHREGFPSAQVAPVVTREGSDITATFYVHEGRKVLVADISFEGISIPEKSLKEVMSLKEGRSFNPDQMTADQATIREFYAALGYLDVSVAEPRVDMTSEGARIHIQVDEGRQVLVASVVVEGADTIPDVEFHDALTFEVGAPYNDVDIADARRSLLTLCRSHGFTKCHVGVSREFHQEGARIAFRVTEGSRRYFGKTIVVGNAETRYPVVQRELEYSDGEPFNHLAVIKTRQELYKLNLFSVVEVEPLSPTEDSVDLRLSVEERPPGTVEFGLGYGEYERLRGFLDVSYRNLFGMNRKGTFRTEQSSLESRFILSYDEPWLLGRPIASRTTLQAEERKERNIDTGETRYELRRYTASTGVERPLGRQSAMREPSTLAERTTVGLYYEYSLVETFNVQPDVVLSKEDTGRLAISSLSPSIIYDSRDNPFDPQGGLLTGMTVKVALEEFVSETDFVKVSAHASTYRRLFRWLVIAFSLRGGLAEGLRETEELPLVERFFLGGRDTVRGYDEDELGPKGDDDNPTGGNAFLLTNVEFRVRMTPSWRTVLFLDGGNVWVDTGDTDLADLLYTAGIGLQYNTPVGPIRIDYGHKLDRKPGESSGEVHFSIGHAF